MNEPIAQRAYYAIGEVRELTGIESHVLRYWETRFDVLRPVKNQAGNRVYRPREVELILLLKRLLEKARKEALGPELRGRLKSDLQELMDILSVPDDGRDP